MIKPAILYIAHRIPYPPNKGDKIRSYNEIKYLSQRYTIDLICLVDNHEDMKYENNLKKYCRHIFVYRLYPFLGKMRGFIFLLWGKSISEGYFYHGRMKKKVLSCLFSHNYKTVVCFSSSMAQYVISLPCNLKNNSKLIMDFCDMDSDKWSQYSRKSTFPLNAIYKVESNRLFSYEMKINQAFDTSVFVSEKEAAFFKSRFPEAQKVVSIGNGVDFDYFCPDDGQRPVFKQSSGQTLLFVGAMDYHANIDGVLWFCDQIYPLIRQSVPDLTFLIVGSRPSESIKKLNGNNGITVTGSVDDIRPYYQQADICVVPLRLARGIQNKVLEAMAMAKPVVLTSIALQGIDALPDHHVLTADTPEKFNHNVLDLIHNNNLRTKMGQASRQFVIKNYDWSSRMAIFDSLIGG